MEAPPYSPRAQSNEMRIPDNYAVETAGNEENILDILQRLSISFNPRRYSEAPRSSFEAYRSNSESTTSTSTSNTSNLSSNSMLLDLPPNYTPIDTLARSFRLSAPLIYITRTSTHPRYHLSQELTRSGKPSKIHIRRLLPSETRSSSISGSTSLFHFDNDTTLYTCVCNRGLGKYTRSFEMRGKRSRTLNGVIKFETSRGVTGKALKVWHFMRNERRDALRPENEGHMMKYGYRADQEFDKRLLFVAKRGVWVDEKNGEIARVDLAGEIEIVEEKWAEGWRRDLLVSCWVVGIWMEDGLRWED